MNTITRLELRACRTCNLLSTHAIWRRCFSVISRLGDGVLWYSMMAVLAVADGRTGLLLAVRMALMGLVGLLLYTVIKRISARPRPCACRSDLLTPVPPLDRFSFPSGHTLHACTFTVLAVHTYPVLAWMLVPITGLVMASRLILGLHYPSDILAGMILGGLLGWSGTLLA